jgi:hypothetical protein
MMVNVLDTAPVASVDTSLLKGLLQDTGTALPATTIVG